MDTALMASFIALQEPWTVGVFMNNTKSIRGKEVFPVDRYGCELYHKVECQRIDTFELWC